MKKKLIVLTGPTAAGKTDLSIKLAKRINGEIISADSVQVYKGFDIGSAKIMPDEMQGVPHHLIDVYEPDFPFDVTVFQRDAKHLVDEIYSRGHIPIIVGGTGFYIQSLLYDISFDTEVNDTSYRQELEDYIDKTGDIDKLYNELKEVDPASAEIIHKNNHRKIIRALEFYHFHKRPISEHNAEERKKESVFDSSYFVITMNRERLYSRIDKRVDIMKNNGLYEEVKCLIDKGVKREYNSMQAIGYKEIYDAIILARENSISEGTAEYNELIEKAYEQIKLNTRHFAKRQLTWFRREKEVIWLDRDTYSDNYLLGSEETDDRMLDFMIEQAYIEETEMDELKKYYLESGISEKVYDYCSKIEEKLKKRFEKIDKIAEYNQIKVQQAMAKCRLAAEHLSGTTGYGYNDAGRDTLEQIYAEVFHTEDALVRQQITCGTHALTIALAGNLRPGDEMLSVAGSVYDTLQGVIGIRPEKGSLKEYGISYEQVDLLPDGGWDFDGIREKIKPNTKLVEIQRSKGYDTRPSLSVEAIGEVISFIKDINPEIIIMVDNCYGEFVETIEPSDVGADMVVGSLIKNIGGGMAPIGGYICGTHECIENAAARLITPGIGKEVGASLGVTAQFAQGLFMAPVVTAAALKGAIFAANVYEGLGFKAIPDSNEERYDIIEAVTLGSAELIEAFCEGIQSAAPVDSYVKPVPWAMPGYDCDVIMAAGAFVSGASIELSADAPIKEPYAVYFQGGLTYPHAKYGIMMSLQKIVDKKPSLW